MKIDNREAPVVKAALEYLELKGVPCWRINSGAYKTERGGFVRYGAKGMSDIHAIGREGVSIWIECKKPKGGVLSEEQKKFLDKVNESGGIGIVVNSIESLKIQLEGAGAV
jgi:hypothetical protein